MMTYLIPTVLILLLVIANGLFVAAEFAIVAARKSKMDSYANEGNAVARYLLNIIKDAQNKDRYIAIAQLGITLASIGLGMYGERSVAGWIYEPLEHLTGMGSGLSHTIGTIIAVAVLTYLHVVIGEMIPKALALQLPEQTSLRVAAPMRVFGTILAPVVLLLNGIGTGLLRLLGVPVAGHGHHYSVLELEQLVEESYEGGAVAKRQHELIDNIFSFGERTVGQLMTPRTKVIGLDATSTKEDILELMQTTGHSRFPVFEDNLDYIIGILHIKDFIKQQTSTPDTFNLRSLMRRAPRVPEHTLAENLLESFKRLQVHIAIVTNEFGGTAGIVTLEDLVEEVVGDVQDEYDDEAPRIQEFETGVLLVQGDVLIDELNDAYDLKLTAENSETVAGLVLDALGRAPQVEDEVDVEGLRFKVEKVNGLVISSLHLTLPKEDEPQA